MFATRVRKYICRVLIYCNHNLFQNHRIIPILFGDCLYSGGDTYDSYKRQYLKMWIESCMYGNEKFLAGGSAIFVLGEN